MNERPLSYADARAKRDALMNEGWHLDWESVSGQGVLKWRMRRGDEYQWIRYTYTPKEPTR